VVSALSSDACSPLYPARTTLSFWAVLDCFYGTRVGRVIFRVSLRPIPCFDFCQLLLILVVVEEGRWIAFCCFGLAVTLLRRRSSQQRTTGGHGARKDGEREVANGAGAASFGLVNSFNNRV
jgi:hypothetical protein